MITFSFIIGKAFLTSSHPITIPRAYYRELEAEELGTAGVSIATQCGRARGIIYSGNAGWGPYFQICARGRNPVDTVGEFTLGQRIIVAIERAAAGTLVTLR
jgi:hypothetical protein